MYVFSRLSEARDLTEKCLKEYNKERPHESLGDMTPVEYLESNQPETYILLQHYKREGYACKGMSSAPPGSEESIWLPSDRQVLPLTGALPIQPKNQFKGQKVNNIIKFIGKSQNNWTKKKDRPEPVFRMRRKEKSRLLH